MIMANSSVANLTATTIALPSSLAFAGCGFSGPLSDAFGPPKKTKERAHYLPASTSFSSGFDFYAARCRISHRSEFSLSRDLSLSLNSNCGFRLSTSQSPGLIFESRRWQRRTSIHQLRNLRARLSSSSSVDDAAGVSTSGDSLLLTPKFPVETRTWKWRDYNIRYQSAGKDGPPLVLIHGFGANCDHWRKNIPELAASHRVYAIDLLGYGFSDKPDPRAYPKNTLYTFETWGQQVLDFCKEIVNDTAFLICNSVGGIVGLQSALVEPQTVRGLLLMNISLRMLHIRKQRWYARPFVRALQNVLRNTNVGQRFFKRVATPASVKSILRQCYHDDDAVTDELVEKILGPGLLPGAVDVFLDFICYSDGPLPEDMLPQVMCPTLIAWGEKDPWEPVALGKAYGKYSTVEDFVILPNVGHCPQDEAPQVVNPLVADFVQRHSS